MRIIKKLMGLLLALFLVLSACDDTKNSEQIGTLKMTITDAPFPIDMVEEANITIVKVLVKSLNDSSETFTVISEDTMSFNLLELRNGISADLLEEDLPVGEYSEIRLFIDSASLKIKDGELYELKVPSGSSSGLKIKIDPAIEIAGGLTSELQLDFSLDKSFVLKGNPYTPAGINGFNFKPVIRVSNLSTSGTVLGTVSDTSSVMLEAAEVWVYKDSVITTAYTNSLGYYAISGLPAGEYEIYATLENYDTVMVSDLEIVAANKTEQDFVLTRKE